MKKMAIAITGEAIVNGVFVPKAESLVLQHMVMINCDATVPQISKAMNEKLSDSALYTLLGRLADRGLVERSEVRYEIHGSKVRRVVWKASPAVYKLFGNQSLEESEAVNNHSIYDEQGSKVLMA